MIPFKGVPFGSNIPLEAVLPPLEVFLEVFFCEVLQCSGYSSACCQYSQNDVLIGFLDPWEEEKVTWWQNWGIWCCRTTAMFLSVKNSLRDRHCDRCIVGMMQKPSVGDVWLKAQNPFL
jgi:hypothetical protein